MDDKKLQQRYKNKVANAQGQHFENYINSACIIYRNDNRAEIDKTPEPFRVLSKDKTGKFTGRFIANAQPDFKGALKTGMCICFEAKYTLKDNIKRSVLTNTQLETLDRYYHMGAITGVCIGIQDRFYFIPFLVWKNMKNCFGRQYVKQEDIKRFEVKFFNGAVLFLDYITKDEKILNENYSLLRKKLKMK
ncbi:Holliday junction resolvase RecU [Clostridioides sp. ES-S-0190-01]|uniref:Holliday junction resolvase RecU n=1 Tax=Clostridioides sp. ES-S-0190-01 TaxID=2770787 RepID=UPI001D0F6F07|nr:Holliday junction resolvase RecU [Clostridioides sp. ES-S-0190-01]